MNAEQRSDPRVAKSIIDSFFKGIAARQERSCLEFIGDSIQSIPSDRQAHWGFALHKNKLSLNVGWVNALVLDEHGLSVLVHNGTDAYRWAPGCSMKFVKRTELYQVLPSLTTSHHAAVGIASRRATNKSIRDAHSTGVVRLLSEFLHHLIPNPRYTSLPTLHLLNGGYRNGDKKRLERTVMRNHRAEAWVVPKAAAIGDDVVIAVAGQGLFATGKIASNTKPRVDWPNRYGADLAEIQLIKPPIPLRTVQKCIPNLRWAKYPRHITTPSAALANKIRELISSEKLKNRDIGYASPSEVANWVIRSAPKSQRTINQWIRSAKVRKAVLDRAGGVCEGCERPAPFRDSHGLPFLETHHTSPVAESGPDHPHFVIALCPNCHRRAEYGEDAIPFSASLIRKLAKLSRKVRVRKMKQPSRLRS